jgi:hypothetical protein
MARRSAQIPLSLDSFSISTKPEQNRLRIEDSAVHDWYRFVLSFPPHLVRTYIERFGLDEHHTVLDPFCGTGTTLVECKKQGIASVGIEALPMAHFASSVKLKWCPSPEALREHAAQIAAEASRRLKQENDHAGLRSLSQNQWVLLLKDSISP